MWMATIPEARAGALTARWSRDSHCVEEFLRQAGLEGQVDQLIEILPANVVAVLTDILRFSLVDRMELVDRHLATRLAASFVADAVSDTGKFYTNGNWGSGYPPNWNPMTDSLFDAGVVFVGESVLAAVWVEESA
jgi:hypothetical protein